MSFIPSYKVGILTRYISKQFILSFFGTLAAFTLVFLMFDFFDRVRVFVKEGATIMQILTYVILKIPMIIQLMTPVGALLATLFSIGKLSQLSEITAMRACGASLWHLARPLMLIGLLISVVTFIAGETIVPWSTRAVEELYQIDIRKKAEKGSYSRQNYWYRQGQNLYNVGLYDSRSSTLSQVSVLELNDNFQLLRRIDAPNVRWQGPTPGWMMENAIELYFDETGRVFFSQYKKLPLVIREHPRDFYAMQLSPESMGFFQLGEYIKKLQHEGVPVRKYVVDQMAKLSFPLINFFVVVLAFPLSIVSVRSRTMTRSFIYALSAAFTYYLVHAFFVNLGASGILPIIPAAWGGVILFALVSGYMMAGAETRN
jgi:lipopolysaccharide export system permease protein